MEKSYALTLSVFIDLPEGARLVNGAIHFPDGSVAIPQMSFLYAKADKPFRSVSDFEDINDIIGAMEYGEPATIREMEDADLPTE